MPPLHLPGYPGGFIPTAIGMRFRRHNAISLENTAGHPQASPTIGSSFTLCPRLSSLFTKWRFSPSELIRSK